MPRRRRRRDARFNLSGRPSPPNIRAVSERPSRFADSAGGPLSRITGRNPYAFGRPTPNELRQRELRVGVPIPALRIDLTTRDSLGALATPNIVVEPHGKGAASSRAQVAATASRS